MGLFLVGLAVDGALFTDVPGPGVAGQLLLWSLLTAAGLLVLRQRL